MARIESLVPPERSIEVIELPMDLPYEGPTSNNGSCHSGNSIKPKRKADEQNLAALCQTRQDGKSSVAPRTAMRERSWENLRGIVGT
jgi:hypothetical protein